MNTHLLDRIVRDLSLLRDSWDRASNEDDHETLESIEELFQRTILNVDFDGDNFIAVIYEERDGLLTTLMGLQVRIKGRLEGPYTRNDLVLEARQNNDYWEPVEVEDMDSLRWAAEFIRLEES